MSGAADDTAVTEYLYGLKPQGTGFGIDRMRVLADALGHPEKNLPVVHIAGTNGKGSVAAMLDAILRAAGWRVGLYTSPHLVSLGERVQIDRHQLTPAEIAAYVAELEPLARKLGAVSVNDRPSFFEYMTAMAFLQFTRNKCDIGVIETGLGGQLDATNIVQPEVSVITSIGMDHCEFLGNELTQIASAKAGIIKRGTPVIIGRMPPEAEHVIRQVAARENAPVMGVAEAYGDDLERYPETNLEGDYQRWNAATATLAARALASRWRITDRAIAEGLKHVDWPGRWQRVSLGGRRLILDASHNPEGAQVLESNLSHLEHETGGKPIVITGALGLARARPLLETIARHAKAIYLTVPNQPRACTFDELESALPLDFRGQVKRSTVAELFPDKQRCTAGGPDDVVVVTGSIYLLGEVMARLT